MSLEHLKDEELIEYNKIFKDGLNKTKRFESQKIHNMDTKFGYHLVRLLSQCEQVLSEETLILDDKARREQMKAVRRGEVSLEQLERWFEEKELTLEKLYRDSKLRNRPDEDSVKQLLIDCLEEHYGSLGQVVYQEGKAERAISEIQGILQRFH